MLSEKEHLSSHYIHPIWNPLDLGYSLSGKKEHLAGADLYTTVILGLFASIIILLMFRSIRWKESLDDQVTLLLSSMQLRVEHDEGIRQKKKMRQLALHLGKQSNERSSGLQN
ncbi:hypothetical protein ANCCEY_11324 [Ancylostoma ceylanicum]|uniref:Uncharacterized protein n=1 Tax=Ancylostoma ceylanicum TaxID=53326 RepID=A0A0D6LBW9_9BILA|nr:hypothetical protein ANCCEY_11324 [Ancylostoma ceylanicum]